MKSYDLAIIGSGPGGYVAGLYASRKALRVCVIEKGLIGGTCLNRGCIPAKSLLNSASILSEIKDAAIHGIEVSSYRADFAKVIRRKDEVVARLRAGIETLFKANSIDLVRGHASISDPFTIAVDGSQSINAKNIIIASGSRPAELRGIDIDETDCLTSDGILGINSVPKSLVIIGGGVIGCEFAGLFNVFGSKVTIVEFTDRLLPGQSREVSKKLELIFKKRGIGVLTLSKAEAVTRAGGLSVKVSALRAEQESAAGMPAELHAEKVMVSVGRRPNSEGLGLERLGIKAENGHVMVDEYLRTEIKNIYAIGDCVAGPLLAHKASYDGIAACDNILGDSRKVDYSNIPNCIWTDPEIASVGLTEEEARAKHPDARVAKFPYLASGKACIEGKTEGFVKIIGNSKGSILGVEIFGKGACDLIGEAVMARTQGVTIGEWARVVHGHPTLSEILQEAAHIFCGTAIHSI
ncbi:MAG: dihydrolipoyl dehydrogenase [Candidatus Omnitrophota bacterium]|nr:dihydrolipoyl dehydrogenase [Candidatus Omnitrophota bacterium]